MGNLRRIDDDWINQPGVENLPIFDIPLDRVIIDELHLLMRITDRLEEGLIRDLDYLDEVSSYFILNIYQNLLLILTPTISDYFILLCTLII